MKNQKEENFQKDLTVFLDERKDDEFKGKSIDEILPAVVRPMMEKIIGIELYEHLGYCKYEVSNSTNSRNGYSTKTVHGLFGSTEMNVSRN